MNVSELPVGIEFIFAENREAEGIVKYEKNVVADHVWCTCRPTSKFSSSAPTVTARRIQMVRVQLQNNLRLMDAWEVESPKLDEDEDEESYDSSSPGQCSSRMSGRKATDVTSMCSDASFPTQCSGSSGKKKVSGKSSAWSGNSGYTQQSFEDNRKNICQLPPPCPPNARSLQYYRRATTSHETSRSTTGTVPSSDFLSDCGKRGVGQKLSTCTLDEQKVQYYRTCNSKSGITDGSPSWSRVISSTPMTYPAESSSSKTGPKASTCLAHTQYSHTSIKRRSSSESARPLVVTTSSNRYTNCDSRSRKRERSPGMQDTRVITSRTPEMKRSSATIACNEYNQDYYGTSCQPAIDNLCYDRNVNYGNEMQKDDYFECEDNEKYLDEEKQEYEARYEREYEDDYQGHCTE